MTTLIYLTHPDLQPRDPDFGNFMTVIKGIRSSPDSCLQEKTGNAIRFSDQAVRNVFFRHYEFREYSHFGKALLQSAFAELAVKYCSFALSKTTLYGFSGTVRNIYFSTIADWFRKNGIVVGQHFIVDFINAAPGMQTVEQHKEQFLDEVLAACCNDVFINGFMLECFAGGSTLPVIAFLNYVDYLDPSLRSSDGLLHVWMNNPGFKSTIHYREHDWLQTIVPLFDEHTDFFDDIKNDALRACQTETFRSTARGGGYDDTTTYGKDLADWINSADGPRKYGLRSETQPHNTKTKSYRPPPHGH